MKFSILAILVVLLSFSSCKKENLLDSVELSQNPYENPELPYVTVESYDFPVRCSQARMNIKVHLERLPEGMDYTRHRIEAPDGSSYIANRTTSLFVEVVCGQANTIYISLVNEVIDKESPRFAVVINA